jgi:probable HAF family extracellular repeat protein
MVMVGLRPLVVLVFVTATVLAGIASASTASTLKKDIQYTVTPLPNINDTCVNIPNPHVVPNPIGSIGNALNASGQVAGASFYCVLGGADGSFNAAMWPPLLDIGNIWQTTVYLGWNSTAEGINDSGVVVGGGNGAGLDGQHALLFKNGVASDLGSINHPGPCDRSCSDLDLSGAEAINGSDQIVGWSSSYPNLPVWNHAFLYTSGAMRDLGTLGGTNSSANAINDSGLVVGWSGTPAGTTHAFRVDRQGNMIDLGTLGGTNSAANGINQQGEIVGTSDVAAGSVRHAFVYHGKQLEDLGTLGGSSSSALGINKHSVIVGQASVAGDLDTHAFVYTKDTMKDLNDLVPSGTPTLVSATAVNDKGQIVANAGYAPCPFSRDQCGDPDWRHNPFGVQPTTYLLTPTKK